MGAPSTPNTVEPDAVARGQTAAQLWRSWTGWVTLGELCGFAVPAVTAAVIGDAAGVAPVAALLAAGAVEGALLGAASGHVLRRVVPAVPLLKWVLATSAAAVVAWFIGLLPMLTSGFDGVPLAVVIPMAVVLGIVLLGSIGTAQWWVLRRYVPRAGRWILTTAGAWTAGLLAFTAVSTPLWQPGQSIATVAAIGVVGGVVMAFTVAALTGWAFVRLVPPAVSAAGGRSAERELEADHVDGSHRVDQPGDVLR